MRSLSVIGSISIATLVATPSLGCLEVPIAPQDTHSVADVVEPLKISSVERIDLLLAIDNSGSMADKQEILARAVPDLVKRLANPPCVDANGVPASSAQIEPNDPCPIGTEREFYAVPDIHIGIVSSSLGGPKGLSCGDAKDNDKGHLLVRGESSATVPTYQNQGFLAWDPNKQLDPPGETVLDSGASGLVPAFQDMVRGVGEDGCGYEAQMESWYRFLIDPEPSEKLIHTGDALIPDGIDHGLLKQRAEFLRPDSLVAIVMLTDENDCSVAPGPNAAKFFDNERRMVAPRSECKDDPNHPCCSPCDETPVGCNEDPTCKDELGNWVTLAKDDDNYNLRCFDQKHRFGKSYLHPISRYTRGLTEGKVPNQKGELVQNPLFTDLNPNGDVRGSRSKGLVFLTGIVGVPWQDIANDPKTLTKGLKTAKQMAVRENGVSTWDIILGDPELGVAPKDPHMIEDTAERSGINPVTGEALSSSDAGFMADKINGHERQPDNSPQFACIFPLITPVPNADDCNDGGNSPLCQLPDNSYSTTQYFAKAYPGVRELSVLKGIADQAIVASVCPSNMDDSTETDNITENDAADFGYRPAIGALVDQLKSKLGHQCLPRKLTPNANGQVACLVIEARNTETCSCATDPGREVISEDHFPAVIEAQNKGVIGENNNCFCEVPQLAGDELIACQNQKGDPLVVDGQPVDGFCYIDATSVPKVGSEDLVPDACTSTERRLIRLVGKGKVRPQSEMFIMCSESSG